MGDTDSLDADRRAGFAGVSVSVLSLRSRVVLTVACVLLLFSTLSGIAVIRTAREAIREEVEAGMTLARNLSTALVRLGGQDGAGADLAALVATLSSIRHVRIGYRGAINSDWLAYAATLETDSANVPGWFERLVLPRHLPPHVMLRVAPPQRGMLILAPYAHDELLESWHEARTWLLFLGMTSVVACLSIFLVVGRSLRPLAALDAALQRVEGGDLEATLSGRAVPEISRLNRRFNEMAASLRATTLENRRLARDLADTQTRERRWLARELHDEMSPTLFKIRVDLHGAMARLEASDASADPYSRLESAHRLVVELQQWVRRLLRDLYPLVLEELGLVAALTGLIEEWRQRMPGIAWSFVGDREWLDPDPTTTSNIYRIAEEALVNAARHSAAQRVTVRLALEPVTGADAESRWLRLEVEDDGRGDPRALKPNVGLRSMRDRARALGGECTIAARDSCGLRVIARVPLVVATASDGSSTAPTTDHCGTE